MNQEIFRLNRVFKAPRHLVWDTFSHAKHLGQWMSPAGMKPGRCNLDFREGGIYHYEIIPAKGESFWGRWIYREIVEQELIANHISFSDEGCGITQHLMAPDWPLETFAKFQFSDVEEGTLVTLEMTALGSDPVALKAFEGMIQSLSGGWGGTFDHLDLLLEGLQK